MPSRDAKPSRPQRSDSGAGAPQKSEPQTAAVQTGEDVWDLITDMKGSGGDGKFDKMNTSFFLRDDEEAYVAFIDENPVVFMGHNIKCMSDAGKTFYRTESCQKTAQDYCTLCDMVGANKSVQKANRVIGFRVLDYRGKWDSKTKALDGVPAPKIFLAPIYFAKQVKLLKDECGGTISDKVIKINKNGNYIAAFSMDKLPSGGFDYEYVDEAIFDEMELPEIMNVYAPLSDDDLLDFMDKFAAVPQAGGRSQAPASTPSPASRQAGALTGGRGGRGR